MKNAHEVLREMLFKLRMAPAVASNSNLQTVLDQIETLSSPYMVPIQGEEWTKFDLSPMQVRMVCLLHTRLGKLVTRDGLMDAMWFDDPEGGKAPNNVSVQIFRMRGLLAGHYTIETVSGRGYIMHRVIEPEAQAIAA